MLDLWRSRTLNEKMMWGLILVLIIGIATRWRYVWGEIASAFGGYFE
ncbi:hypothetical protein BN938_2272 [Mucinivorans hirudinis]|uniref:Uncharacterized protein n=1 Tax=Mucinivorans hirudinis TaxID=1433126 RepID=A0A060RE45_9BACT|nr:hypothetical protein BN938_2272 [Mucinivorans hirudinis]